MGYYNEICYNDSLIIDIVDGETVAFETHFDLAMQTSGTFDMLCQVCITEL